MLPGAVETKVRPAVVIASDAYLVERPDVLVGILTSKPPHRITSMDHILLDWQPAGLRGVSCFRALCAHGSPVGFDGDRALERSRLGSGSSLRAGSFRSLK